jgi:DNA-binding transcriptional MerR regulator
MSRPVLSSEVCDRAGITYRQLDHWVTNHLLHPTGDPNPGQGPDRWRQFTEDETRIACWMALLVRHGIQPHVAASLARDLHTHGHARLGLFHITTAMPTTEGAPAA